MTTNNLRGTKWDVWKKSEEWQPSVYFRREQAARPPTHHTKTGSLLQITICHQKNFHPMEILSDLHQKARPCNPKAENWKFLLFNAWCEKS